MENRGESKEHREEKEKEEREKIVQINGKKGTKKKLK